MQNSTTEAPLLNLSKRREETPNYPPKGAESLVAGVFDEGHFLGLVSHQNQVSYQKSRLASDLGKIHS